MWSRTQPIESSSNQIETWTLDPVWDKNKGLTTKSYEVHVTHGKPIDILQLKLNMVEDYQNKVDIISKSRKEIYAGNLHPIKECPICRQTKQRNTLQIYGAQYVQCENCTHYFVNAIPTKESLNAFYKNDKEYQSTYADPRTTQTRIEQVAKPKLKWVIEQYERLYGRKPRSILDVGAGSGHFIKACRDEYLVSTGIEPSISGRRFAGTELGIDLVDANFTLDYEEFKGYDIVTFWGVLEHVTNPMTFLDVAKKVVSKKNLVVVEVPRWNCLSTTIQTIFPNSVVRHLDPLGHIQCFTDSSLATAFVENGYSPVAAWYFGMDAYELVTQLTWWANDKEFLQLGEHIPTIQERLDLSKLSDEIVICGKV